ncbi:triose-phosphate isomerase [Desulfobulbus alkaliphilus]|uniref:triose-phosphate isomerase n=1 Tax=Desulfobulbus alkaliphilus TaxID=869814 RepID=UPI001963962B|nr:triose-phosphate isomerase family protein [Desulfobulbus alkaliphilus]MBM9538166.1 triosephosphate isomerase [Desulfobulbus alkaliphilus]
MKKIILANWKAYFAPERALQWCEAFAASYQPNNAVEVVLAVPALYLARVQEKISDLEGVYLAAQSVSAFPQGEYTGSLPAAWLRGLATYALIGHQERRRYFHETIQDVARQGYEALAEELQPIVCVDESLVRQQAAAFAVSELKNLIWACTPETKVSLEMSRSIGDVGAMVAKIAAKTENRPILYGGGVTVTNGPSIWRRPEVSGMMLGKGCLDATAFATLVNSLK